MNELDSEGVRDPISNWLKNAAASRNWQYVCYSRKDDFTRLWNIYADSDISNDGRPFLIDWNEFPAVHPLFPRIVEFLTPIDWALAVAYDLTEANLQAPDLPEVVIVDRCSHRFPGSFAVEMHRALVEALGHVSLFSAFGSDSEDAFAFVQLLNGSLPKLVARGVRQGQLRALRQAWIGYTVQSQDHHDLNNVLGPLVLGGYVKDDVLAAALLQLTRWFHMHANGSNGDAPSGKSLLSENLRKGPLDVLLIDDMAELGWASCVEKLFATSKTERIGSPDEKPNSGSEEGPRLIVATTPYALFPELCKPGTLDVNAALPLFGRAGVELQALARLPVPSISEPAGDQIVLIDLRFFSRSIQAECAFFRACVDIAIAMTDASERFVKRWSDDRFSRVALKALKTALDEGAADWEEFRHKHENQYLEALSLFIRLLAQRYFTTPFILFSSTGKRRILEFLRPYGNVMSAFDKPRIAGSGIEVEETLESLGNAVRDAGRLVGFRRRLMQLLQFTFEDNKPLPQVPYGLQDRPLHVEVYLDETKHEDHKEFASAAVVLVYPSMSDADRLDRVLPKCVVGGRRSLRWWGPEPKLGKIKPSSQGGGSNYTEVEDTVPVLTQQFKKHLAKFKDGKPAALGIVVKRPSRDASSDWDFDGSSQVDGLYNQMLRFLVETTIYEVLPEVLGRRDFTWRGFFPARIRPKIGGVEGKDFSTDELIAIKRFWGLEEEPLNKGKVRTYGPASFRTLVEEIVRNRCRFDNQGASTWRGAVGVGLNSSTERPRTIHDLADWYAYMVGDKKTSKLVGTLLHYEFRQKLSLGAETILAAGSYAARDDRSRALSECFAALPLDKRGMLYMTGIDELSKITLHRVINRVVPSLTGEDMVEVLRLQAVRGKVRQRTDASPKKVAASEEKEPGDAAQIVAMSQVQGVVEATRSPSKSAIVSEDLQSNEQGQTADAFAVTPTQAEHIANIYAESLQSRNKHAIDEVTALQSDENKEVALIAYVLSGFNSDWDANRIRQEVENAVALNGRRPFLKAIEVGEMGDSPEIRCKIFGVYQLAKWIEMTGKCPGRYNVPWSVVLSEHDCT